MTQPTPQTAMSLGQWGLLFFLSLLWGGSFLFIELALTWLPPMTLVLARIGLAAATLWAVIGALGIRPEYGWRPLLIPVLVMGLLNNAIPFTAIVWAQTEITASLASILNATTPLFVVLLAHVLTQDEKLSGNRLVGVLLGITGVAVMMGDDAFVGLKGDLLAQLAMLAASLSYAFAGIWGKRFKGVTPILPAAGMLTASMLMMAPLALFIDKPWQLTAPQGLELSAVIALAVVSTAGAYLIYFRLLRTAGATNLLLVTIIIPPTAIVLGIAFLGERLQTSELIGMALIVAGLLAIDGRLFVRRPSLSSS